MWRISDMWRNLDSLLYVVFMFQISSHPLEWQGVDHFVGYPAASFSSLGNCEPSAFIL